MSNQQIFAAPPKLQTDFSYLVGWLQAKPGKLIVMSGRSYRRVHDSPEASAFYTRQVLPHNGVVAGAFR